MSIPDAPWVGKCREDYYGCDEEETYCCEGCGEEHCFEDLIGADGRLLCRDCFEEYYHNNEEGDDELYG